MYDPLEPGTDPSQNFLEYPEEPLDKVFNPQSVAVIGATEKEGSVGRTLMHNLTSSDFGGRIFPINPKRSTVLGKKCYPSIESIPEDIDLVIVVTPAKTVPSLITECVKKNIKAGVIISAGFKELGEEGQKLEEKTMKIAHEGGMRIIGPNCLGVMNPILGLNGTFAADMALPGNIAFISQSGAMCTAVLDWSFKEKIGFSSFISIGSMADVGWGDLINYLGNDPNTKSILIYMESIGDPRLFLSAARRVALTKPIVVIKSGRTEEAAEAAASHTGSLAGSDDVLDAAFKRAGVMRVDTIEELFMMALVLAKQSEPKGPNLTILTNAGGPAVLATDATALGGANLTKLDKKSLDELNKFLPDAWSHANPVDLLGDADADRYQRALKIIADDKNSDGILVILSPQDMTEPYKTAEALAAFNNIPEKTVLTSWMGGPAVEKGAQFLKENQIPCFEYPDTAASVFARMWQHSKELRSLYETPILHEESKRASFTKRQDEANNIIQKASNENRSLLTEMESKELLKLYDIPVVETIIAASVKEARQAAEKMGFPVVLKLHSETITHKTDVGGVKLNIKSIDEVEKCFLEIEESVSRLKGKEHFLGVTVQQMISLEGYELILGSTLDIQFGPVMLFGSGGQLVEVFKDSTLALPPLNTTLARKMMEETKIFEALLGVRGRESIDITGLEMLLVNFSELISELPWIKECDINPLLASTDRLIALDARIILHDSPTQEKELSHLAIRPYPIEYIKKTTLKDQTPITLRPLRPEDESKIIEFHKKLSEKSVRNRYFQFLSLEERTAHDRLTRILLSDYDYEMAIVVEEKEKIVGVARIVRFPRSNEAYFKLIIADKFHGKGLGTLLIDHIIDIAKKEGITTLQAQILEENNVLISILEKKGFRIKKVSQTPPIIQAKLNFTTKSGKST
ncbi:MAG: bifunctional acetate--CoA ligase family protein/GNAT family N-acetyltransferase [Simkaniaceae bacterium]